jgi:glycosyltransferase involved in cell wall biosynthesis
MKILIINTNDISGGAARAAFRLHDALLKNNIDSQMLVADKKSDVNSIITLPNKNMPEKIWNKLDKVIRIAFDKLLLARYKKTISKKFGLFSPQIITNKKLVKTINEIHPDIVHLHWICFNFLSIADIAKINAPIVWSLHDMWAFTGGCHYVVEAGNIMCDKYTQNCGICDFLGNKESKDLSFKVLRRKKKAFTKIKSMTVIGLSKWLQNCAKSSSVFASKRVVNLPNPINTDIFKPMDKFQSRVLWNLPKNKKLILFGAMAATSTPYKGFTELIEALNKINTENVEFVVFGSSKPQNPPQLPCKVHYLGHLHDDARLVSLYSACDVMIIPSKRENLSNAIMESLSCGTLVVCFDIGGNSDMVNHKINGYLAQSFDTFDLAKGIDWVLNNENYDELSKNAREKVVREFDYGIVAKRYINLYEEILRNS